MEQQNALIYVEMDYEYLQKHAMITTLIPLLAVKPTALAKLMDLLVKMGQ